MSAHAVEMENLLCLGNNMEKYLCIFSTDAILCPEYFQVMLDGETVDKEGHPRSATSLARSEDKRTECEPHVQGLAPDRRGGPSLRPTLAHSTLQASPQHPPAWGFAGWKGAPSKNMPCGHGSLGSAGSLGRVCFCAYWTLSLWRVIEDPRGVQEGRSSLELFWSRYQKTVLPPCWHLSGTVCFHKFSQILCAIVTFFFFFF